MELGLSLGDSANNTQKQEEKSRTKKNGLDFSMSLGLNSSVNQEEEKIQISQENDDADDTSEGDGSDDDNNNNLQLNLLPLAPVPLQISSHLQSLPWSSDNGSSENGSSGNLPVARGFDVNRLPVTAEEVSSAYSVGSPFCMDFGIYRSTVNRNLLSNNKRDFEAIGNDVVEAERASSRASDDDENGLNARKKLRLSKEQSAFLEESFKEHNTLNPVSRKQKLALAKQLNLRPRQVEVWFQNRRARIKLKQTEVDCEYLKRCCDALTEENRRLQKDLQDLRALKTTNPYYMQLPATTLTMCPSCERVATTSATAPPSAITIASKVNTIDSPPKPFPFPLTTRPRFNPFSQNSAHPNQSAAS